MIYNTLDGEWYNNRKEAKEAIGNARYRFYCKHNLLKFVEGDKKIYVYDICDIVF